MFWNFSTFACLVCVTNFAALGWRFKCVSHLAWLHFNSRRVQLGETESGTGELTLTSVCNCLWYEYICYGRVYYLLLLLLLQCSFCTSSTPALSVLFIMSVCCCCCYCCSPNSNSNSFSRFAGLSSTILCVSCAQPNRLSRTPTLY